MKHYVFLIVFLFFAIGLGAYYKGSKIRTTFNDLPNGEVKFCLDVVQLKKPSDDSFFYVAKNGNMTCRPHILYGDPVFNESNDNVGVITESLWERRINSLTLYFVASNGDVGVGDKVWIFLNK